MRYPPDGTRGSRSSTRGAGLGGLATRDVRAINRASSAIIQIESPSAVEHAAEIAAIDGVDVLFVGPADLSHSLGVPGQFDDPRYLGAIGAGRRGRAGRGQGGRILLYDRARAAPSRTRLPVHRARRRRRLPGQWRASHRSRAVVASLTHSSADAQLGGPRPAPRPVPVWATTTPPG